MGEAVVKIDDVLIHGYSSLVLATIITRIPRAYSLAASLHRQRRHAARLAFHLLLLAESRLYRSDGSVAPRSPSIEAATAFRLAMTSISRRDFLNGVALTVAAGLTPAAQIAAEPARYPPALTGLRGQHPGSFEIAHAQARESNRFALDRLPIEEHYDLVVVGAGISGLAAAFFYRRAAGSSARILVLDNHDDFGGHAKRNEFTLDG